MCQVNIVLINSTIKVCVFSKEKRQSSSGELLVSSSPVSFSVSVSIIEIFSDGQAGLMMQGCMHKVH